MLTPFDYAAHGLRAPERRPALPCEFSSVGELLAHAAARFGDREALSDRHVRYSFRALDERVARTQAVLESLGIGRFDRVAASAWNSAELVVAHLATLRLGAIWVGINRSLAAPEKAHILRDAGVALLLCDDEVAAQIEPLRSALPALRSLLRLDDEEHASELASLVERATPAVAVAVDPHAPAAIAYTSGTSGFPKGAVHSQHNLLLVGALANARGDLAEGTVFGSILPLTILNLMVLGPLSSLQRGSACALADRIDAPSVAAWIARERVGYFAGVPTLLYDLLSEGDILPAQLATLRRVLIGGADTPEPLCRAYRERFNCDVIIGYGMTEAPTAVTMTDALTALGPGMCGRALAQVRVEIVSEEGRALPLGEVGEVCVAPATSGPAAGLYTFMLGYWNQPEATAKALAGEKFHSGDLGFLDEKGDLFLRGRRSDLILRGGANVYPAEVERVLSLDARVVASAVLGRTDARLGERVVAFVQCKGGSVPTGDELRAHCVAHLARYKVPEEFHFVDDLPRNSMGKIVKPILKRQLDSLPIKEGAHE